MPYIWEHPDWPHFYYDPDKIENLYASYSVQKKAADIVFGMIDPEMKDRMHARSLTDEIVASLEIEGEHVAYDSVYSSICKRLDIHLETKAGSDAYAMKISKLVLDATGNLDILSLDRMKRWHTLLFSSIAGRRPGTIGEYRKGPVYIQAGNSFDAEIIYEGVPAVRVAEEMDRLLRYINTENEKRPLVKSAVSALWFLCIHPFEDGNGRISRAVSDFVVSRGFGETSRVYSMSSLILKNRNEYYRLLNTISSGALSLDLTTWIAWNIQIAQQAIQEALHVYEHSMRLTRFMKRLDPSAYNSRQISMLYKLADGSFEGKLTTDKWSKMNKCSPAAASRDIQHLLTEGLLVPSGETGPRTGYFLDPELMDRI